METFLSPILTLGILGGIFGLILQFASNVFFVEEDPRKIEVEAALPGANCGACGYPGCSGLATAIAEGIAPVTSCPVGGQETANNVAKIMGVNAGEMEKKVACVICQGDCNKASDKFEFKDSKDCRTMNMYYDGNKNCTYGCLGGGTCFDVCEYDAIRIIDGLAVIDKDKCTACNRCIEVCPKHVIDMIPYSAETVVKCNSHDNGKVVKSNCSIGCIGCKLCVKNCPEQTIDFNDLLAKIDYSGCTQCGVCASVCPTGAIFAEYDVDSKEKVIERKKELKK